MIVAMFASFNADHLVPVKTINVIVSAADLTISNQQPTINFQTEHHLGKKLHNSTYPIANRRKYNHNFNNHQSKKTSPNATSIAPALTTSSSDSVVLSDAAPMSTTIPMPVATTTTPTTAVATEFPAQHSPHSPSYSLDYLRYVGAQITSGHAMTDVTAIRNGVITSNTNNNIVNINNNNINNSKNQNYFSINAAASTLPSHDSNKQLSLVSPNNCISPSAATINYYNTHQNYFHPAQHYHQHLHQHHGPAPSLQQQHHQQQQQQQQQQPPHLQLPNYHMNNNYSHINRNVPSYQKRYWHQNVPKKRQSYPNKSTTTDVDINLQNGQASITSSSTTVATTTTTVTTATTAASSATSTSSSSSSCSSIQMKSFNTANNSGATSQMNATTTDTSLLSPATVSMTPPRDTKSESPPSLLTVPGGGCGGSAQLNGSPKHPNHSMTQSLPSIDTLSSPHRRLEYDSDSSHSSYHQSNAIEYSSFRSSHSPFHMTGTDVGGAAGANINIDCSGGGGVVGSDDLYFRGHQQVGGGGGGGGGYYGSHQNLTMWNSSSVGSVSNGGPHTFGSHGFYSTSSLVTSSTVNLQADRLYGHDGSVQQKRCCSERNSPQGNASSRGGGGGAGVQNRRQHNNFQHHRQLGQVDSGSLFTPPDRFLARSYLVEIKTAPGSLLNGSKWDPLSKMVWDHFFAHQQTEDTYKKKMYLWRYLYLCVRRTYPRFGLYLVGSTISGFGSDSSDVDMCLVSRTVTDLDPRHEAMMHLNHLKEHLTSTTGIFDTFNLIQAKVPILRFKDSLHLLEVDLNFNNCVGIRNTHLLYCYSQMDWRLRPLALVVKLWAQFHNINNAKDMTISSYSLVLMTIHFLQCAVSPPVLPCLHAMYPHKFQKMSDTNMIDMHEDLNAHYSGNDQTLGELFLLFLEYYSSFNYANYAISIRTASLLPIEECRLARSLKNDPHQWKELCIEEPFDLTNTARSVYDCIIFERIKSVFVKSYQTLHGSMDLGSIFTTPFLLPSTCSTDELS